MQSEKGRLHQRSGGLAWLAPSKFVNARTELSCPVKVLQRMHWRQ